MKRLFLMVPVLALATLAAYSQQDDKGGLLTVMAAPPPTDVKKADKTVNKKTREEKKAKAVVEDYTPQAAEYGRKAKCPVSGEEFKVSAETKAVKYKGKTYYFCCGGCAPKFKKHPAKFAK